MRWAVSPVVIPGKSVTFVGGIAAVPFGAESYANGDEPPSGALFALCNPGVGLSVVPREVFSLRLTVNVWSMYS